MTIDMLCARCGGEATQLYVVQLSDGRLCYFRRCEACSDAPAAIAAEIGRVTSDKRQAIVTQPDDKVLAVVLRGEACLI